MEKNIKRRYSLSEKEAILSAFKKHSGSVKSFLLETGVCYPTLRKWLLKETGMNTGSGFVELNVAKPTMSEIHLPNGILIRIDACLTADFVHQLMMS